MLKTANLGLAFFLELCALAAFAYWGFTTPGGLASHLLWGLGAPALMIIVWGSFLAPRASRPLPALPTTVLKLVIFGLAALALLAAGAPTLALIFAALVVINFVLLGVLR
jgi:hypothetical protein